MAFSGAISVFVGQYAFLSNFYLCPVMFEGDLYPSSEHAFQAAKTHDPMLRSRIASQRKPHHAKQVGRSVLLREDWNEVRVGIMTDILRDKFTRNPKLRAKLLATGNAELVEGNTWGDTFWGVCDHRGENKLGHALMRVRSELRADAGPGNRAV